MFFDQQTNGKNYWKIRVKDIRAGTRKSTKMASTERRQHSHYYAKNYTYHKRNTNQTRNSEFIDFH